MADIVTRQGPGGQQSSSDEFLKLIQNPFKSAFQVNAFWASLGTSLGITLALAFLFSVFRPRNTVVYAPKIKHADKKHAPPAVGKGLLAWIDPVWRTKEPELTERIGLDATLFLRFTRMCRNVFLILAVFGCLVMIPVNVTQSDKAATNGLSVFATMTPMYVWGNALWSHVAVSWTFDIVVAYFLWHNYRAVRSLRRKYFQSQEYQMSLHARTVMVTQLPPPYRSDEGLLRITDEVNPTPSIPRATIGRNMKELPKLIAEHEKVVRQLEEVLAKYFKNPDRLPAQRPTCRPSKKYLGDHNGSDKVDAIDYLTDRIRDLEVEIKHVRESIDKRNAMPYGFVSWDAIENAHAVAYTARKKHPHGTTIKLAPRPNDIIWENLALSKAARRRKRFTNIIWSGLLTVLWIAPNAMIAIFLTDLANLGLVWPAFQTSLNEHPKVWAAVQGIASPAVTSLVYLVLPIIFRRLAIRAGDLTKTSRERHVIHSLYAFFVFNNLVVFSAFSAVWGFVTSVIKAKDENKNTWDAIVEGQFYMKVMFAVCQVSPFWVTWLLQRNLGAAVDLIQLVNMVWIWFARKFLSPTPRKSIEWTAPPPFDYASYYNYFLFYATVALCFATLQPIVLPVTALYFAVDSWLKKYLLLYVFVTKTESGGRYWRVLYNRLIFAVIFANCVTALVIKARGTWTMIYAMAPLPILMLLFKWYCKRTFDDDLEYYNRAFSKDSESLVAGAGGKSLKAAKKATERLRTKFGHPALYKPLTTPMVYAKGADALEKIFQGRQGGHSGATAATLGGYSDIALHSMSATEPGKSSSGAGAPADDAPFEIVAENQLDFSYFKNRHDFQEEFGGGIYGRPEDMMTDRSQTQTPKSFVTGTGYSSPGSSRASSPAPSLPYNNNYQYRRTGTSGTLSGRGRQPLVPNMSDHPAFRQGMREYDGSSPPPTRTGMMTPPTVPAGGGGVMGTGFYQNPTADESMSRLLSNVQGPPLQQPVSVGESNSHFYRGWDGERDPSHSSYEAYRSERY